MTRKLSALLSGLAFAAALPSAARAQNSSANITAISLEGGSYNNGFSPNGNLWSTINGPERYLLGVSQPGVSSPLLNSLQDGSVSIPPSQWANGLWTYNRQCGSGAPCNATPEFGTAVRITITFSDGNTDQAVFTAGSTTTTALWQQVTSTGLDTFGLSGTPNTAGVQRVGAGSGAAGLTPNGPNDVLQVCINSCPGGGGSGVTVSSGPVLTESVLDPLNLGANPNDYCPATAPAAASAFHSSDPIMTIWLGLLGLTPQSSVQLKFSYNGTLEPQLEQDYNAGTFQSGGNYLLCPSIGRASTLAQWGQAFGNLFPNNGGGGSWTLGVYLNLSSSPLTTVPFTVQASGGGGGGSCTSPGGSGTGLSPAGSVDAHYCIFNSADQAYPGPNAYVSSPLAADWISNASSTVSQWISPRPDPSNGNALGNYTYRTTFSLAGLNPSTATLTGRYATDNSGVILLNGVQVGSASSNYATWTTFTIGTGFVAGLNTLDFVVTNTVGTPLNPTGLRVEISGSSSGSPIPVFSTGVAGGGLGGGTGNSSANIVGIALAGGSYNGGTFSPNNNLWNTTNQGANYLLGVSEAGTLSLLNSKTDGSVNLPPSEWANGLWTYDRQCGSGAPCSGPVGALEYGTAVRITINFSNGNTDQAVFNVGSPTSAALWQLISGSATGPDAIILSGTIGNAGVAEVGAGGGAAGLTPSAPNDVLQLCINSCTAGSGGGGSTNPFTGTWNTTIGTVTMSGIGNTVTGSYPGGTFTCTVSGNTCTGTYTGTSTSPGGPSGTISLTVNGSNLSGTLTPTGGGSPTSLTGMSSSGGGNGVSVSLNPPGQSASSGSSGGPYTVGVTANGAWTATPNSPWIQVTSGNSGNGNGTVTFTVSPNSGPPQVGSITIGGQTEWIFQNGTPSGTSPNCVYVPQGSTILPIPISGTASGGPIRFSTGPGCQWAASQLYPPGQPTGWVNLIPPSSGANNGAVSFAVPVNTTLSARSSSIVIAGENWVINQDGPGPGGSSLPSGTPNITPGGVMIGPNGGITNTSAGVTNAASYAPAGPPNGIAQGSFFSIFGTTLGPTQYVQSQNPLPTTLSGVSVQIIAGGNTYQAYLVFVSAVQINAILPSNVPVGNAQVTVTNNGATSAPIPILVSAVSFGVFFQQSNGNNVAIAQNVASATYYPLNVPSIPAMPGQIVIVWGTGLGPINGPDNVAPGANATNLIGPPRNLALTITVAGVPATQIEYAGRQAQSQVDNIYFTMPSLPNSAYGCQVPVAITAGGVAANVANIAVTANGAPCQ